MIKSPDEPLWDSAQTAAYLGIKPRTLRWLRSRGEAPVHLRVGNLIKYRPQVVRDWVREQERAEAAREVEQASA